MEAPAENTGQEVLGSIGWLVDRTNQQILGSVWLADNSKAITCAHLAVPYSNFPEALQVNFPATGIVCGVKEIEFHPDFDRWMAKRFAGQSQLVPAFELISQAQNVAALKLVNSLKQLDRDLLPRVNAALSVPPPQGETIVSGQAGRIELTSVLQTLVNARNFGTLVLLDERNHILARLFLEDGKLTHAQFRNSRNEEAIYRLITSDIERFPFHFTPQTQREAQWCNFPPIEKSTAFLLMEAYRRMEELGQMLEQAGGPNMVAVRRAANINFELVPEDWRPLAAYVWNCVNPEMSLGCLTRSLSLDAYSVIGALQTLCASGQIALEKRDPAAAGASLPLEMANDTHLSAGEDVYALGIDPKTNLPVIMRGFIVEEFWQGLDQHQVTSISLPLELAGAPLVKDGAVIGIHCGPLVQEIGHYGEGFEPQLMISVQAAQTCLGLNTPQSIAHSGSYPPVKEAAAPTATPAAVSQGFAESTGEQSRFTSTSDSHTQFRDRMETRELNAPMQAFSSLFGSIKGAVDSFKKVPPPPPGQFLQAQTLRQSITSEKFSKVPENTEFQNGDIVRFEVKVFEDCHIFALVKSAAPNQPPRLIYPYFQDQDVSFSKGAVLTLPERNSERSGMGKQSIAGLSIPNAKGREEIYMLASRSSLLNAFNIESAEQIVADNLSLMCQEVAHGSAITRPAGAIFHGLVSQTQVFDPMEKINVLCLRLSHQRP